MSGKQGGAEIVGGRGLGVPAVLRVLMVALALALPLSHAKAQVGENPSHDILGIFGTKIVWGENRLRFSGEYQARFDNFLRSFNLWMVETRMVWMPISILDVDVTYRFSMKPEYIEHRLQAGAVLKFNFERTQVVNQNAYMFEPAHTGQMHHGGRHMLAVNYLLRKTKRSALVGAVAGIQYGSYDGAKTSMEFFRYGFTLAVKTDDKFGIVGTLLSGYGFQGQEFLYGAMLQLVWTLHKKFKYVPALYLDY